MKFFNGPKLPINNLFKVNVSIHTHQEMCKQGIKIRRAFDINTSVASI